MSWLHHSEQIGVLLLELIVRIPICCFSLLLWPPLLPNLLGILLGLLLRLHRLSQPSSSLVISVSLPLVHPSLSRLPFLSLPLSLAMTCRLYSSIMVVSARTITFHYAVDLVFRKSRMLIYTGEVPPRYHFRTVPDVFRQVGPTELFLRTLLHGFCSTPIQGSSGNRIPKRLPLLLHLPALLSTPLLGGSLLSTATPQVHHAGLRPWQASVGEAYIRKSLCRPVLMSQASR